MKQKFRAKLRGGNVPETMTFVSVPKSVIASFAPRRHVPVRGTINGFAFRTTIAHMGAGPCIGVNTKMREGAGVKNGDMVDIVAELDSELRAVRVPTDLLKAMSSAERERFSRFSFTHQKEFVQAIEEAKKPETRLRRLEKTLVMIRAKM